MLQLHIYEAKEPNLKLYGEIKLTSREGREKNPQLLFVEEPEPDVLSFDPHMSCTPSAHPHMADSFYLLLKKRLLSPSRN